MTRLALTAVFAFVLVRMVLVLDALEARVDAPAAEAPVVVEPPAPAAPEVELAPAALAAGTFDSNWGEVRLRVDGARVTGDYDHNGGRIEGTLDGNVIRYRWTEASGGAGRGVWVVGSTGVLVGTWGTGNDEVRGGGWNLTRHHEPSPCKCIHPEHRKNPTRAGAGSL